MIVVMEMLPKSREENKDKKEFYIENYNILLRI